VKLLYVTSFFPPEVGGIASHVYGLARRMKNDYHHDVTVFAYSPYDLPDYSPEGLDGAKIARFRSLLSDRRGLRLIPLQLILKVLQEGDYDVVHVHGYDNLEPFAVYLPKMLNRRHLLMNHSILTPHYHPHSPRFSRDVARHLLNAAFARSIFQTFSSVVALTNMERDILSSFCSRDKIAVIPNGIDLEELNGTLDQQDYSIGESKRFVLYAGVLMKYKGVHHLLSAIREVRKVVDNVSLLVVGNGPERDALIRLSNELGISGSVAFSGFLERRSLVSLFNRCELFAMPSSYEAFSIPTAEAMACGKPVIACNTGGIPELGFNPEFLFEYGDVKKMARLIISLLKNQDLAHEIGKRNRLIAIERFSWTKVAERLDIAYTRIANAS
jgi:glycosyltransferase involved in cell wall biosynthesis